MARRKRIQKTKRGLRVQGINKSGVLVCVDKDGNLVFGDGCLGAKRGPDGALHLTVDYDKCNVSPEVNKAVREQLYDAAKSGALVKMTFVGTPVDKPA